MYQVKNHFGYENESYEIYKAAAWLSCNYSMEEETNHVFHLLFLRALIVQRHEMVGQLAVKQLILRVQYQEDQVKSGM